MTQRLSGSRTRSFVALVAMRSFFRSKLSTTTKDTRFEELEAARVRKLRELAADWRAATDIRSLVEAVEARGEPRNQLLIEWARSVAELLDPSLHIARLEELTPSLQE